MRQNWVAEFTSAFDSAPLCHWLPNRPSHPDEVKCGNTAGLDSDLVIRIF